MLAFWRPSRVAEGRRILQPAWLSDELSLDDTKELQRHLLIGFRGPEYPWVVMSDWMVRPGINILMADAIYLCVVCGKVALSV